MSRNALSSASASASSLAPTVTLSHVPNELMTEILTYVGTKREIARTISLVSRHFHDLVHRNPQLQHYLCSIGKCDEMICTINKDRDEEISHFWIISYLDLIMCWDKILHTLNHLDKVHMIGMMTEILKTKNPDEYQKSMYIIDSLQHNTSVTTLDLFMCKFTDDAFQHIIDLLNTNTTIRRISLYAIGDHNAIRLAEALESNRTIEVLELGHCRITPPGAVRIAEMLERNTTLRKVYLNSNDIQLEGVNRIAQMIARNTTLSCLSLVNNMFDYVGYKNLQKALIQNPGSRLRLYVSRKNKSHQLKNPRK